MTDGSEKRNRQLAFELQNSHVCEKRSKMSSAIFAKFMFCEIEAIQEETLAGVKIAFRQKAYK